MEQPGIPTYILITAIGVVMLIGFFLFSLASNALRSRARNESTHLGIAERTPNPSATQAPAGSMAERRHNIEELLQRKERESQDA